MAKEGIGLESCLHDNCDICLLLIRITNVNMCIFEIFTIVMLVSYADEIDMMAY